MTNNLDLLYGRVETLLAYNRVELSWVNLDLSYRQNQTQIGAKCLSKETKVNNLGQPLFESYIGDEVKAMCLMRTLVELKFTLGGKGLKNDAWELEFHKLRLV